MNFDIRHLFLFTLLINHVSGECRRKLREQNQRAMSIYFGLTRKTGGLTIMKPSVLPTICRTICLSLQLMPHINLVFLPTRKNVCMMSSSELAYYRPYIEVLLDYSPLVTDQHSYWLAW